MLLITKLFHFDMSRTPAQHSFVWGSVMPSGAETQLRAEVKGAQLIHLAHHYNAYLLSLACVPEARPLV